MAKKSGGVEQETKTSWEKFLILLTRVDLILILINKPKKFHELVLRKTRSNCVVTFQEKVAENARFWCHNLISVF